jgi:hypothetical protein
MAREIFQVVGKKGNAGSEAPEIPKEEQEKRNFADSVVYSYFQAQTLETEEGHEVMVISAMGLPKSSMVPLSMVADGKKQNSFQAEQEAIRSGYTPDSDKWSRFVAEFSYLLTLFVNENLKQPEKPLHLMLDFDGVQNRLPFKVDELTNLPLELFSTLIAPFDALGIDLPVITSTINSFAFDATIFRKENYAPIKSLAFKKLRDALSK